MAKIKNLKVYGLFESMIRSGLPMTVGEPRYMYEDGDLNRSVKLSNTRPGSGHDNFLKGIIVQFDLKYPQYLSPQLQRYHWIDIVSSQSKMHRIARQVLGDDNCNKYVTNSIRGLVNKYISDYNKSPDYNKFMRVVSNLPMGFEMWMAISTNYQQLKTVYSQRRNHKLKEDWGCILEMIRGLPSSNFITGDNNESV